MASKTKKSCSISLMFPFVSEEKCENLASFLEANGFDVKNIKARAAYGDLTVTCSRASPAICLCCLEPLQDSDSKESNQLCKYCSEGNCEIEASKLKFEKGHGNIQHILHSEEETDEYKSQEEQDIDLDDEDDSPEEDELDEEDEE